MARSPKNRPASSPDGFRRIPARGPIQGTNWTINGLNPTTKYYWSVQAIDTAFDVSPGANVSVVDTDA